MVTEHPLIFATALFGVAINTLSHSNKLHCPLSGIDEKWQIPSCTMNNRSAIFSIH